jgi:hypothetical protein
MSLELALRDLMAREELDLPLPGKGRTALRHRRLAQIAIQDLSLARLAEAHTDAVAILAEAGREREPHNLYGVWAAETSNATLHLEKIAGGGYALVGAKLFCSGAGLLDRALVTVTEPEHRLVDVRLKNDSTINVDTSGWATEAFSATQTATVTFQGTPVSECQVFPGDRWYLDRVGFWHGACGPACCWAGGAVGIVEWAKRQKMKDAHAVAHLGAMSSLAWGLWALLDFSGQEIDQEPNSVSLAQKRALSLRHLVEESAMSVLRHFGRAFGPRPLAFDRELIRRYRELELYVRQTHGEADLEVLGHASLATAQP